MDFVFFDIECACVSKKAAKICAFGYVVTDDQFHIKEKRDLLINPQGSFHLTDRRGEKGLVLPYDYNAFKRQPSFPEVYPDVARLLTEGNVVLGHSIMNDVKYLNLETARFSLPPLNFSFYDTQFIYMNKIKSFERQLALGTIAEALGVEFVAHRAADDAYATMKIAEALCKREGMSLKELIDFYEIKAGVTKDGEAVDCTSSAREEYLLSLRAAKERRERSRAEFIAAVCGKRPKRKSESLRGKVFSFSKPLEEATERSIAYVKAIYERGGGYSFKVEKCNRYVALDGDISRRKEAAQERGALVLNEESFKEMLI